MLIVLQLPARRLLLIPDLKMFTGLKAIMLPGLMTDTLWKSNMRVFLFPECIAEQYALLFKSFARIPAVFHQGYFLGN